MKKKEKDDDVMQARLLTVRQAAKWLNISVATIYCGISRKARNRFPIKPIRFGASIRFDIKDIEAYLEDQKTTGI